MPKDNPHMNSPEEVAEQFSDPPGNPRSPKDQYDLAAAAYADAGSTDGLINSLICCHLCDKQDIYLQRLGSPDECHKKFQYVPRCIYFFYLRLNNDGCLKVEHYFYVEGPADDPSQWKKIPYDDVEGILYELALNARPSGNRYGRLSLKNFEKVKFRRKSYVAFFLDEGNWAFHKRADRRSAMIFNSIKAGVKDNFSFFDAKDFQFPMPRSDGHTDLRTGIFMINHMKKNAQGDDLEGPDPVKFAFDMFFDVRFAEPTKEKLVVIFDPGGDNQGPPQQP